MKTIKYDLPLRQPKIVKTEVKLTRKQKEFVRLLLDNKKISGTEAAEQAYNTSNKNVAHSIASENLTKPAIISALGQHIELTESTIVGTMRDWKSSTNSRRREIALDAAKFTHDKLFGKATQRVEQESVSVNIDIDLT